MERVDTVQDLFRSQRKEWVLNARSVAMKLLKKRHSITIIDVLKECPRPSFIHPNATGSIFNRKDFVPVGYTLSTSPIAHKRVIRKWALRVSDER